MSDTIRFVLNGKEVAYEGAASERLLDVLRDTFLCRSVKCGCKEGECGACSVLIGDAVYNSCCVAVGAVEGEEITTLEGFKTTKAFRDIEEAFGEVSAVQCGFCIPGMVLSTEALLRSNPSPTNEEIREGLSGNLCRCTGYNAIVKAVALAAKNRKGGQA